MKEQDVMATISKGVNLLSQVALIAAAVNEFAVKAVEHVPVYAPIVVGILAGSTSPILTLGGFFGRLFGKK